MGDEVNVIYVDVLMALNFFINYFILLGISKFSRYFRNNKRFILSSVVAAAFSLIIFLPELNLLISLLLKLIITSVITLIGFGFENFKRFFILVSLYYGISFLYAGTMFFVWLLNKSNFITINNSIVYLNISPIVFIISVIIAYVLIIIVKKVLSFSIQDTKVFDIKLSYKNKTGIFKCFYDSGNFLQDIFTDSPIIIIDSKTSVFLSGYDYEMLKVPYIINDLKVRIIPCETVDSKGVLYGYRIDSANIIFDNVEYSVKPIVAVSEHPFRFGCSVLIGDSFYNQCKELDNVKTFI